MHAFLAWIGDVTGPWQDLYSGSSTVETAVTFLHIGALVASGGVAFTLDRAVLLARHNGWPRRGNLARDLHQSHAVVIAGLGVVLVSGLALTASDPKFFLTSPIYWTKMGVVFLLLLNGWFLKRSGERLLEEPQNDDAFRSLRAAALRSASLWGLALLGGVALTMYV